MGEIFKGLLDKAPDIIDKMAQSPLGLAALIVLVLGIVGALLFRVAAGKPKFNEQIDKKPLQRFATIVRSGVFLIGLLGAVSTSVLLLPDFFESKITSAMAARAQLRGAEAALLQARNALNYVQSVGGKLDFFLGEVARRSERLPDPTDRSALAQETQAYKSLMNDVNATVLAALNDISSYEANRPRQHSSTYILSIAALAQTPLRCHLSTACGL